MRFLSTWQSIWRLWKKGQKYNIGKNDYNLIFHYFCDVINTNSVIFFRNINKIIGIHEDIAWEWLCNIVNWKQLMVLVTMDTSWEMNHRQEKSSIKVLIHDMPQCGEFRVVIFWQQQQQQQQQQLGAFILMSWIVVAVVKWFR